MVTIEWLWITEGVCKQAIVGDEAYYLRLDPDGLIRLRNDTVGTMFLYDWAQWPDAERDASIAVAFEAERAKHEKNHGWMLHRELNRRGHGWSYSMGDGMWRARYFHWYSERCSKDENLRLYKIVVGLPEGATLEDVMLAMGTSVRD